MNRLLFIRKKVFQITQIEMGEAAGVPQSVVSRWENDILEPNLSDLARIRDYARSRGIKWDDRRFFEARP